MGTKTKFFLTTMFRYTMITMPLIASLAAGLNPNAANLIRRFAEQGAYTAGQTTTPNAPQRRRLPTGTESDGAAKNSATESEIIDAMVEAMQENRKKRIADRWGKVGKKLRFFQNAAAKLKTTPSSKSSGRAPNPKLWMEARREQEAEAAGRGSTPEPIQLNTPAIVE